MLDLEASGKHVFYAAPGFANTEKLSDCYVRDTVAASSIFVRPSAIGMLNDDGKHHIAFQIGGKAYFCSEPKEIETVNIEAMISDFILPATAVAMPKLASDFFEEEAETLLEVYEKRATMSDRRVASQIRQLRDRRSPAEYAAQIARTLFETELLIIETA